MSPDSPFFNVKYSNKYFYRIAYDINTGKTLDISRYKNVQESFIIDETDLEFLDKKDTEVDIIPGISCLPDNLDITKSYQLKNFKDPNTKNDIKICLDGYEQQLYYHFTDDLGLCISSNLFNPDIYGHISRSIFNKYHKKTRVLNGEQENAFSLVDHKNEVFYRNKFINSRTFFEISSRNIFIQISDACYVLPKFYKNILYTNFSFEKIHSGHFSMIKSNYDEVWLTSRFQSDYLKKHLPNSVTVKTVYPGIQSSIFNQDNLSKQSFDLIKNSIPGLSGNSDNENKYVFANICQDTFRSGVDVLIESYYKAFNGNRSVFLMLFIEPISYDQVCNSSSRIKYYQGVIDSLRHRYGIKQIPYIYFQYGNISQQKRAYLYRLANCFVLTSRAEGCCLPFLESIMSDCDVISHNHTGIKEIFEGFDDSFFVPTIPRQAGTKEQIGDDGLVLQYDGDYPQLSESPDFTPMNFNTFLHDYNENSINVLANLMAERALGDKTFYRSILPSVKNSVLEKYDQQKFYDVIEENLNEIKFN